MLGAGGANSVGAAAITLVDWCAAGAGACWLFGFAAVAGAFAPAFDPAAVVEFAVVEFAVVALELIEVVVELGETPLQPLLKAATPAIATAITKRQEVIRPQPIPMRQEHPGA